MAHPDSGIISNKMGWTIDTHSNLDESQDNTLKRTRPVSKAAHYMIHLYDSLSKAKPQYSGGERISGCRGLGDGRGCDYSGREHKGFGGGGLFRILVLVLVIKIYTCVKIHRSVYQRQPNSLYVNYYKTKTLTSTVESILVSRHPSWPGPKCGLTGSMSKQRICSQALSPTWALVIHWLFSSLC